MRFLMDLYRRWTSPTTVTPDQIERLRALVFDPDSYLRSVHLKAFLPASELWRRRRSSL